MLLGSCALNPNTLPVSEFQLPVSTGEITLNELTFDDKLDRLVVPGGSSGALFLVNPETREVKPLQISEPGAEAQGQAGGGVVSATRGPGLGKDLLFVLDQNGPALHAVDPSTGDKVASAATEGIPEIVRYIFPSNELWVTEPDIEKIEIFKFTDGDPPTLKSIASIPVPGGPEGLVYDFSFVYTNQPEKGLTTAFHVFTHELYANWGNGCTEAGGMALDEQSGYLFVACGEGKLVTVDVKDPENLGRRVASQTFGDDLQTIDYNPHTGHIYLPSGASSIVGVFSVIQATPTPQPTPEQSIFGFLNPAQATPTPVNAEHEHPVELTVLTLLGSADTGANSNCIASDPRGNVWVCDPQNDSIFWVQDTMQ
jgi:hypothetical protein